MRVNDYINPFTDEKYVESIRELIEGTREGAIVVMDGRMYEMMERSHVRIPSIVLFDYEHEDCKDTKFVYSYKHLCDILENRLEKVLVIGGFDAWSSLIQYAREIHFLVSDEKWNDDMMRPFLRDVHSMCRMISYSSLPNGMTHEECEFADDVVICSGNICGDGEYELFCSNVLSHVNSEGEPVDRILPNKLSITIESGDKLSIITDFKIYKTSPNIYISVVENPRFRALGIVMESWEIVNGNMIISFVNNSQHREFLDYRKVIAVAHINGDHKLIRCDNNFCENSEIIKWEIEQAKHQ